MVVTRMLITGAKTISAPVSAMELASESIAACFPRKRNLYKNIEDVENTKNINAYANLPFIGEIATVTNVAKAEIKIKKVG